MNRSFESGFTFIELIVVITLIGGIIGISAPFIMSTLEKMERDASVREVTTLLRTARSRAISTKAPFLFSGDMDNRTYWISNLRSEESFRVYELDEEILFSEFTDGDDIVKDGTFGIVFFPQGTTSGGLIELQPPNPEDDKYYLITVDPVTGRSEIDYVEG
jgi:general secretion pathway protein H